LLKSDKNQIKNVGQKGRGYWVKCSDKMMVSIFLKIRVFQLVIMGFGSIEPHAVKKLRYDRLFHLSNVYNLKG